MTSRPKWACPVVSTTKSGRAMLFVGRLGARSPSGGAGSSPGRPCDGTGRAICAAVQSDELTLVMDALDIAPQDRARVAARLEAVGGVVGLWRAGVEALQLDQPWVGRRWRAIVALWRCANRPARDAVEVDGPEALIAVLDPFLSLSAAESFHAVFLDGRGRFLGVEEVGRGSVDACLVHPREVFAPAIRARAASVAVVHNHPSGDPAPSRRTRR